MKIELTEKEMQKWTAIRERGFSKFLWRGRLMSWALVAAAVAVLFYLKLEPNNPPMFALIMVAGNGIRLRTHWNRMESAYNFTLIKRKSGALVANGAKIA